MCGTERMAGRILLCVCSLWCALTGQAQKVCSVVRDAYTDIRVKSETQTLEEYGISVTVLDRWGLEAATFLCGCDRFRSLQSFSGTVEDASGKVVKKIRKSDLQKTEYSSSLKTDDYLYYYECDYPTYPFTVTYRWTVRRKDGFVSYPTFMPQWCFAQKVEHASCRISLPAGMVCRFICVNADNGQLKVEEKPSADGGTVIEAVADMLPPIPGEPLAPSAMETFPMVWFAPSDFTYEGSEGNMDTWQHYGEWQYRLLQGRGVLSEPMRSQVRQLVAGCHTDREKVAALYAHLGKTTRYVSIQLGLGGLQPIAAGEVAQAGFGDCKGLSNYMRAMLEEVGIPSVYTLISVKNKNLIPGFASVNQMDHVILQVPLEHDTLWLECTNPDLPLGYVHRRIAGHEALLILPSGGQLCRLPASPDSMNVQTLSAGIRLSASGQAGMTVTEVSHMARYEERSVLSVADAGRQADMIRSGIKLADVAVRDVRIRQDKSARPSLAVDYRVEAKYGHSTGSRLFVPVNVFRKGFSASLPPKRVRPICVSSGYCNDDSISLYLPEGYVVEKMCDTIALHTPFGHFSSTVTQKGRVLTVCHKLYMAGGTYPPSRYGEFLDFVRQVAQLYDSYLVLRKE